MKNNQTVTNGKVPQIMSRIKKTQKTTLRNVAVKLLNTKEKQPEEKRSITSGETHGLMADFSQETLRCKVVH